MMKRMLVFLLMMVVAVALTGEPWKKKKKKKPSREKSSIASRFKKDSKGKDAGSGKLLDGKGATKDKGALKDKTSGSDKGALKDKTSGKDKGSLKDKLSGKDKSGSEGRFSRFRDRKKGEKKGTRKTLNAAQKQQVKKIVSDLDALKTAGQVTAAHKQKLYQDLYALCYAAVMPPQIYVQTLAGAILDAWSEFNLSSADMSELMELMVLILNSSDLTEAEADALIDDVEAILKKSGLNRQEVNAIVSCLEDISKAVHK